MDCDLFGRRMANITKLHPKSECSDLKLSVEFIEVRFRLDQLNKACYRALVAKAPAGSWVLIEGVEASIMKSTMPCNVKYDEEVYILRPLLFSTLPVVKMATKPLNRGGLQSLLDYIKDNDAHEYISVSCIFTRYYCFELELLRSRFYCESEVVIDRYSTPLIAGNFAKLADAKTLKKDCSPEVIERYLAERRANENQARAFHFLQHL
ncbi:hypothetical protein IFM89_014819 [Coptis chinensis]|uniref:Uncharacterized protein n=1 Tax=Coptis chinensis TaxID=261450 RepID=A0A835M4W0_9MAGN|nr:hypothetical protein IFM89_014819 [Coptis chinensis]